jgi:indole-3-glycerol phosphate synthase
MTMAAPYLQTGTILDRILAAKVLEVAERQIHIPFNAMMTRAMSISFDAPPRDFTAALHRETIALIAEVKKSSPSKGVLIENFDAQALAHTYAANGAAALSVLTDEPFFQGQLRYLADIHARVDVPLLRKDFIIDAYQVYEARAAHADAVLLITAALRDAQLAELHSLITGLGMAALVEVHDEAELERALTSGARVIGINNRDLHSFTEDLGITERLARRIPSGMTIIAESAMRSLDDVRRMANAGVHAVLIGEGLVKSGDIAAQVRAFSAVRRENP